MREMLLIPTHQRAMHDIAVAIVALVESTRWDDIQAEQSQFRFQTPLGAMVFRGRADDVEADPSEDTLLLRVDLGGNDRYWGPIGVNPEGLPVGVHIDLGGNDYYGYVGTMAAPSDTTLPQDRDGRTNHRLSRSAQSRQGVGRSGIGLLFDLGDGNDRYHSLVASQGYGQFGVGVLVDLGGDDEYIAEASAQGAAQFGIGLLIDRGSGDDRYLAHTRAQGFGYVRGFGALIDEAGNDRYACPEPSELALYPSSQLGERGAISLCQGAGFGRRGTNLLDHLSGGYGILFDGGGDDAYVAGVFSQGTGYWQAFGLLVDAKGSDQYDSLWYGQGSAAHYAVGALLDQGPGDDRFNLRVEPVQMQLGAGHDFSVGVYVNEQGDEHYRYGKLSAGAAHCNGTGLFVEGIGQDRYESAEVSNTGYATIGEPGCVEDRAKAPSVGVLLDEGGDDRYELPPSPDVQQTPSNRSEWQRTSHQRRFEFGFGEDRN